MKNFKRVFAAVLAGSMALAVFAGCGNNGNKTGDGGSGTPSKDNSGEVPTLTWWLQGQQPGNIKEGMAAISDYAEEKIGVRVDVKMAGWGDYEQKQVTMLNAGDAFDIMFITDTNYNRYAFQGKFADITDMVEQEAPELWKLIPELVWSGTYINNKIYAVPTYKDSSMTQYYVWDHDYVEKYNIDIDSIKDFESLDPVLRDLKAGEGDSFYPLEMHNEGFNGLFNDYDNLTVGIPPIGVRYDDESRKVVCTIDQDDMKAKFDMLRSWYKDGITNPDAPQLTESKKDRTFFSAQAFPGAEINWQITAGIDKYDMVEQFGPIYKMSTIQGSMNAISSNSQYKAESLKLLEFVNTDWDMRTMMAYGVKDVDWKSTGQDNVIERLTDTWTMAAYQQGTFFNLAAVDPAPGDQYDAVKELNERAGSSVALGFIPDTSGLQTEIANCNATWDKFKYELGTGASDPETVIPTIIEELKSSGMDTIIEELQKQLDEHFA